MKYSIGRLMKEYVEATDNYRLACKQYDDARARYDAALDSFPSFGRFDKSDDAIAARTAWKEEYDAPRAAQYRFKEETALYKACVCEMLVRTIDAIIQDRLKSDAFMAKWDGTPLHYKRFQKAIFGDIDPRVSGYITDYGYYRLSINPTPGCHAYHFTSDETHITGAASGVYRAETAAAHVRYGYADDLPTFKQVHTECVEAADNRDKRRAILEEANEKANAITKKHARGLNALYDALTK